jgi:hypothetical protein
MFRVGDTLAPLIFMSDGTHLPNFAGNNNTWQVYITIGNQRSKINQMPPMHTVAMGVLLPMPMKNSNNPQKRLDEKKETIREVLNEVLQQVLQPLTFK